MLEGINKRRLVQTASIIKTPVYENKSPGVLKRRITSQLNERHINPCKSSDSSQNKLYFLKSQNILAPKQDILQSQSRLDALRTSETAARIEIIHRLKDAISTEESKTRTYRSPGKHTSGILALTSSGIDLKDLSHRKPARNPIVRDNLAKQLVHNLRAQRTLRLVENEKDQDRYHSNMFTGNHTAQWKDRSARAFAHHDLIEAHHMLENSRNSNDRLFNNLLSSNRYDQTNPLPKSRSASKEYKHTKVVERSIDDNLMNGVKRPNILPPARARSGEIHFPHSPNQIGQLSPQQQPDSTNPPNAKTDDKSGIKVGKDSHPILIPAAKGVELGNRHTTLATPNLLQETLQKTKDLALQHAKDDNPHPQPTDSALVRKMKISKLIEKIDESTSHGKRVEFTLLSIVEKYPNDKDIVAEIINKLVYYKGKYERLRRGAEGGGCVGEHGESGDLCKNNKFARVGREPGAAVKSGEREGRSPKLLIGDPMQRNGKINGTKDSGRILKAGLGNRLSDLFPSNGRNSNIGELSLTKKLDPFNITTGSGQLRNVMSSSELKAYSKEQIMLVPLSMIKTEAAPSRLRQQDPPTQSLKDRTKTKLHRKGCRSLTEFDQIQGHIDLLDIEGDGSFLQDAKPNLPNPAAPPRPARPPANLRHT